MALAATPFSRLALTHAFSMAGDALVTLALAGSLFFDISPTAARGRVALSLVLTIAPFGLVAPFLGPAIDRLRGGRRLMVFAAAGGRALVALLVARVLDSLLLFPGAFALLVLSKTHSVAKSSLVPTVVATKEELVEANSRLALLGALVGFVTAAPGVLVLKLAGAGWVMRLAALSFAAAAVASTRIVQVRPDDPSSRAAASAELRDAGIRLAATAMGVLRASVGFLTFLVAFALRRDGAPSWVFGVVLGASMAGTVAGAGVAPRLRRWVVEEHLLAGSLGLVMVGGLAAGWTGGRPGATVAAAALGVAASVGKMAFDSLVQRDAPDAAQGRSFARLEAAFQLVWVAGALIPVILPVATPIGYAVLALASAVTAVGYLVGLHGPRGRTPSADAAPDGERTGERG